MTANRSGYRCLLTADRRALRDDLIGKLHLYGVSVSAIARLIGVTRRTVQYVLDKPADRSAA